MAKEKKPNYSVDQITAMVEVYRETKSIPAVIEQVFTENGTAVKSVAQVRAKLVSLGEYDSDKAKTDKVAKADNGPSKKELFKQMADAGIDVKGLEGANKDGLHYVIGLHARLVALEAKVSADEPEAEAA